MREMKDSGVEWIGEIPKHWELIRIKDRYTFQTGFTPDTKVPSFYADSSNDGFEWITISDLSDSYYIPKETKSAISKEFVDMYHPKIVRNGSLLYSFKLSVGKVAFADRDIYTNEAIASFSVSENNSLKWLYYASFLIEYNANVNIYGARLLNQELINNSYTLFPPLSEQQAIATYLDNKCSEIDAIVSELEQQISILEAYKNSVITETVTKGLNPDVEMKDSGLDWIGEIPSCWEATILGTYSFQVKNKNYLLQETNLLSLSYGRIKRKNINTSDGLLPESFDSYNIIQSGDVVLRLTDLQNDHTSLRVGLCLEKGIITSAYLTLRPDKNCFPPYIYYLLHSFDIAKGFYNMGSGVRQTIKYEEAKRIPICVPPLSEQQAIASYLDNKCSEIDAIISEKKKQVEIIKEYKKSLIYEYVTGKKEVPSNE